jgi:hypothetical protein
MIIEINSENYQSFEFEIFVENIPIQVYISGTVRFTTRDFVPGDMFAGKLPKTVIFRCTVEDHNGYESKLADGAPINFEEI